MADQGTIVTFMNVINKMAMENSSTLKTSEENISHNNRTVEIVIQEIARNFGNTNIWLNKKW